MVVTFKGDIIQGGDQDVSIFTSDFIVEIQVLQIKQKEEGEIPLDLSQWREMDGEIQEVLSSTRPLRSLS